MKIDDYKVGTAFIILTRDKFKHDEDFEDLLSFLKLPLDCLRIDIDVCEGDYKGYRGGADMRGEGDAEIH